MKKYVIIICCSLGIISTYLIGKNLIHNNTNKNISTNEQSIPSLEKIQQKNNIENTTLEKSPVLSEKNSSKNDKTNITPHKMPDLEKNISSTNDNLKLFSNDPVQNQPTFTQTDNQSFSEKLEKKSFQTTDLVTDEIVELKPIVQKNNNENTVLNKEPLKKNKVENSPSLENFSELTKDYLTIDNINIPISENNIEFSNSTDSLNLNINSEKVLINNIKENIETKVIDNLIKEEITSNENCITKSLIQNSKKKLSEIIIANNVYTKSELLKKRIKIKPGDYINERKLQKHLNFINLNPFRKVEMIIDPKDKNTCNIDLICHDRFWFRPYIGFDNTGLKTVDRNRIYTGFNWNISHFLDSILSYQYISSLNFKKFQSHTGRWIIFLPWENILTLYGSYSHIEVDHMIPNIVKNNGFILQTFLRYNICLPILDFFTHDLIFGFDFKRTDTNLIFSRFRATNDIPVNLTQFLLSYRLNWNNNFYNAKILLELYFSPGEWINDQENNKYDNLRRFAKNQYIYAKGYFSNLIKIPKNFLLSLILTGQISNETLLPSETFGLGGYNTVRGYYEREINTDSGVIVNLELRSPSISLIPKRNIKDSLRFLIFFDYGYGSIHEILPFDKKNFSIYGFGPGLRYVINPHFTTRLDWGIKSENIKNDHNPKSLIHFSINLNY